MSRRIRLLNRPFLWLVAAYRLVLSPLLPRSCRFDPTCSEYARQALEIHPLHRALWLIVRRLMRCHPLGGSGHDPVPGSEEKRDRGNEP